MTKPRKYFLSFVVCALSMWLVSVLEDIFCDKLTPLNHIFPLVLILAAYSILLYRISKGKTMDNHK